MIRSMPEASMTNLHLQAAEFRSMPNVPPGDDQVDQLESSSDKCSRVYQQFALVMNRQDLLASSSGRMQRSMPDLALEDDQA